MRHVSDSKNNVGEQTAQTPKSPHAVNLQLRASEARYRRLFETALDGILILDGNTGKIQDVNPFLARMLGYSKKEFLGKHLWEFGAFKDAKRSKEAFLELQKNKYIRYENLPLETKDGKPFAVEFISNVYWVNNRRVIQCNIRDMTERERLREKLQTIATHDALTGLPNRMLLYDRFEIAKANAIRNKKRLALMSLDMDNFKVINDTYGHDIGDKVLQKTAHILMHVLRKSDTVARIGGDEFVLLLWEIEGKIDAGRIAQKILDGFRKPFIIEKHPLKATVSIGAALYPDDGNEIKDLLLKSDRSLYMAKEAGRDTYILYDSSIKTL